MTERARIEETTMTFADSNGTRLYVESTGSGVPIVFVHEFAGDYRNWENQVRFLARRYRCITFNARGYPPSDVP
jgi:pimeloyl-ACP methyl ester carboxylesterase